MGAEEEEMGGRGKDSWMVLKVHFSFHFKAHSTDFTQKKRSYCFAVDYK